MVAPILGTTQGTLPTFASVSRSSLRPRRAYPASLIFAPGIILPRNKLHSWALMAPTYAMPQKESTATSSDSNIIMHRSGLAMAGWYPSKFPANGRIDAGRACCFLS